MNLLGLIGYPLEHSFSPGYFARKFALEGIDNFTYRLLPLKSLEELPSLVDKEPHLIGFNVTIPYKTAIIPYLNSLTPEAKAIGAANTVAIVRGVNSIHLVGHNTDAPAFEYTLTEMLPDEPIRALVLGSGGAARAVAYTFAKLNIPYAFVGRKKKDGISFTYPELTPQIVEEHNLIINCTPVGMYPAIDKCPPLPYDALGNGHILYDLIYNPEKTLFLKKGENRGALCRNGLKMLHRQADLAWEFWQHTFKSL